MQGMKHIGIAGVSAEGAFLCCRIIQNEAPQRLGVDLPPQVVLHMHPFAAYRDCLACDDWSGVTELLVDSIDRLRRAGADFAIIPANAPHVAIDAVTQRASLPVINLIALSAAECRRKGFRRVAILGAIWTMTSGLYLDPMRRAGIEAISPSPADQEIIQTIITEELQSNRISAESSRELLAIVGKMQAQGCDAALLACTELPLALTSENCSIPVIDTTRLLALAAIDVAGGREIM